MTIGSYFSRVFFVACLAFPPAQSSMAAEKPTDPKKPAPPDPKSVAAVGAAVTALVKEGQEGLKPGGKLREKSDYFGETPPPEVTPEAILSALEKSQGGDPRLDAYVKWQLLSAIPGQWSTDLAPRAVAVYRRAPEPLSHPGLDRAKLTGLIYRVGITKKDKLDELNKGFSGSLDKVTTDNSIILRYRKDLYSRLPVGFESLSAAIDDIQLRVRRGWEANDIWETVSGSIQSWALTAEPRQRDGVIQSLNRLLAIVKDDRAKAYTKVIWSDDPKSGGLRWEDRMGVPDGKIQALIESLRDAAKTLGDAGMKDTKKK